MLRIYQFSLLAITLLLIITVSYWEFKDTFGESKADPYIIAFSGPVTNPIRKEAALLQQMGAQLLTEEINAAGGIEGRQVQLEVFDDDGKAEQAIKVAKEIVSRPNTLAVIGHSTSTLSLAAAPIYEAAKIPVVSVSSTADKLTRNRPWHFRTIFNDGLQGRFIAHYLKSALDQQRVVVINEAEDYGRHLGEQFIQAARAADLKVEARFTVDYNNAQNTQEVLQQAITALKSIPEEQTTIFYAGATEFGQVTLKKLRDSGIEHRLMGPDTVALPSFPQLFVTKSQDWSEAIGYTDGVLVAAPLLLDFLGQRAQRMKSDFQVRFNTTPSWESFFAYDAALLITDAIKKHKALGKPETIAEDREKIRQHLASLDHATRGTPGVTGINYFNSHGDGQKTLAVGEFSQGEIISSFKQLQGASKSQHKHAEKLSSQRNALVSVMDDHYFKTAVVYSGIQFQSISDINPIDNSVRLEFDLWLRYQGDEDLTQIEFINGVDIRDLPEPVVSSSLGKVNYKRYHINALFKLDFGPSPPRFGEHQVGVALRHKQLQDKQLIFVSDLQGIIHKKNHGFLDQVKSNQPLLEESGWHINDASLISQSILQKTMGNPLQLQGDGQGYSKSVFNAIIEVQRNELTIRNRALFDNLLYAILILASIFLTLLFTNTMQRMEKMTGLLFASQAMVGMLLILVMESFLLTNLPKTEFGSYYILKNIVFAFDILWWLGPAFYVEIGVRLFVWQPLEARTKRKIPGVAKGFVSTIILLITIFGIIGFVFDRPVTSLLATSGVVAMIIGLAIQMNISHIFSGLAMNLERPFRNGDMVRIGNNPVGRILDLGWRTTRIQTGANSVICIPNHVVGSSTIENFTHPNSMIFQFWDVYVDQEQDPERVSKLITDAALSASVVEGLSVDNIGVAYQGVDARGNGFKLFYSINDYSKRYHQKEQIWRNIRRHLNHAGIGLLTETKHLLTETAPTMYHGSTEVLLKENNILSLLPEALRKMLAERLEAKKYLAGDLVLKSGETGSSMYLIQEGAVRVSLESEEREGDTKVTHLGIGQFFGEMSLLTGEPRSATVHALTESSLLEIRKEDIFDALHSHPELQKAMGELLAERRLENQNILNSHKDYDEQRTSLAHLLARSISNFFK
uniref:Cyclic nucleotide-binding domain-containing protein n=1 Tax=Magnetococcus massalia (strain MO-1) TaxID=451514 RepID=A0A1S7LFR0_MAGMO|nr:Membrane protein of unknown function [Candidatus Magnetococcus massalia]